MPGRWICLDVGETLIDETRVWSTWADALEVPRFTLMAAIGAVVARGGEHVEAFAVVARPSWREQRQRVERLYGGFQPVDLYPDALPALVSLRRSGYRLAILANQPAQRSAELRRLGVEAEVIAMSEELGVHKPDANFFERALALMDDPDPASVAYVGDRVDNDVLPAARAGMRAVWLRRGPWGLIERRVPPQASLAVGSLAELVERVETIWQPSAVE